MVNVGSNKRLFCKVRMHKDIFKEHGINSSFRSRVRQTITAINWMLHNVCAITVFYITARTTYRTLLVYFPRSLLLKGINKNI